MVKIIYNSSSTEISIDQIAEQINLSVSRLRHLFKQEMGISIQRYILWYKLCCAGVLASGDTSVADAATDAGFVDMAHFSRTHRSMFGLSWSQLMKNDQLTVVADDPFTYFEAMEIQTADQLLKFY